MNCIIECLRLIGTALFHFSGTFLALIFFNKTTFEKFSSRNETYYCQILGYPRCRCERPLREWQAKTRCCGNPLVTLKTCRLLLFSLKNASVSCIFVSGSLKHRMSTVSSYLHFEKNFCETRSKWEFKSKSRLSKSLKAIRGEAGRWVLDLCPMGNWPFGSFKLPLIRLMFLIGKGIVEKIYFALCTVTASLLATLRVFLLYYLFLVINKLALLTELIKKD